jgi:hypothetical protein
MSEAVQYMNNKLGHMHNREYEGDPGRDLSAQPIYQLTTSPPGFPLGFFNTYVGLLSLPS